MFKITNRMKRLWNLPGTPDQRFPAVSIGPGETVEVDSEQWGAIVRDNRRKIRDPHWIYPEQKFDMRVTR